jgi:hypothetical protein
MPFTLHMLLHLVVCPDLFLQFSLGNLIEEMSSVSRQEVVYSHVTVRLCPFSTC